MPEESCIPEAAGIMFWELHWREQRVQALSPALHTRQKWIVSEDTKVLLKTGKREGGLWGQGKFIHPELEFQVRTEFVG